MVKTLARGFCLSLLIIFYFFLFGCAASSISREAAADIDQSALDARNFASDMGESNVLDAYQNPSQTAKGALIGGVAGALTGALYSGFGVLPGTATGAILGASFGSVIDARTTLTDQLMNRGINIVVLGDQILIVLPSARIFHPMTAYIKPDAYSTLKMVADYINGYTKMLVKIAAYTNDTGSDVDLLLSQQQATCIAKTLLASGIDARVLYSQGYGGEQLVVPTSLEWGESDNYRIEITLEKLYV